MDRVHLLQLLVLARVTQQTYTLSTSLDLAQRNELLALAKYTGSSLQCTDDHVIITPLDAPLVRSFTLQLPKWLTFHDALLSFFPLLLFSNTTLQITFQGKLYDSITPFSVYQGLFRFFSPYFFSTSIDHADLSFEDASVTFSCHSKGFLHQNTPSFTLEEQPERSHALIELIAPTLRELESFEKLLRLHCSREQLSVRVLTRLGDFYSSSALFFYGTARGFDVARPWILSDVEVSSSSFFTPVFKFDERLFFQEFFLVALALVGGSLPLQDEVPWYASFLDVDFELFASGIRSQGLSSSLIECVDIDTL